MELNNNNFKTINKLYGKENIIILVYASWCGYSLDFLPKWDNFINNKKKNNKHNLKIFQIESEIFNTIKNPLFNKINKHFTGYPNLFLVDKQKKVNKFGDSSYSSRMISNEINKILN